MTNRIRSLTHLLLIAFMGIFIAACGGDKVGDTKDPVVTAAFYPDPAEEWALVWSDEFDGDSLDLTKWGYDLGDGSDRGLERWGNNEQQYYTDANTTVSDGTLKITARAESVAPGFDYTSGRITTLGKLDFKYGRVEASIKTTSGQGLWGAFWMLSSDSPYGSDGWAATGEIDIMEAANPGTDAEFHGSTIFHGFPWPLQQSLSEPMPEGVDPTDFNTYALEWEENELRFFVNGTHFKTITNESYYTYFYNETSQTYELGPDGAPFDTEFHVILNLAVGGNLTGNTVDDAALPGEVEVDYVRVYSCSYGLANGKGCNSNVNADLETPDPLRPGTASYDIYIDEPATYTWTIVGETFERPLAINSYWNNDGALTFEEVVATDRGNVIDIITSNSGNISLNPTDGEPLELFGMGNNPFPAELHAAELRFDILVRDAEAGSNFLVKMDSGYPALGQVSLAADGFERDTWTTVSVKVNDIIGFRGEGLDPINMSAINSIFVFEPTGAAEVQLDNITLSCGNPGDCGIRPPVPEGPPVTGPFSIPGIWVVSPEAGALGVGPAQGDVSWWAIEDQGVSDRSCFFDDTYVFNLDGSFENVLDNQTWIEEWQSGNAEACGFPVAPHDGMSPGTWTYDADGGTLTIDGFGAYLGIPKAVNAGELPAVPTPPNVTYLITEEGNNRMIVDIESGGGVWWRFIMAKQTTFGDPGPAPERTFAGTWQITPAAGSLGVGPAMGDVSWWAIEDQGVIDRACFFDDEYVFDRDGTFMNVLGDETWIEGWQSGGAPDACGAPVAPHDGMSPASWTYTEDTEDNGTLLIDGLGAYMGIPKAVIAGELPGVPVPPNVEYMVTWVNDENVILDIESGGGVWWRFDMTKTVLPPPIEVSPLAGTWQIAPEAASLGVGPAQGDVSWWAIEDQGVIDRACFFDDDYVFGTDGSFANVLGDETWIEGWQSGGAPDACGAPVAPHDGMSPGTFTYDADAGTVTIDGFGAYLGIPKAVNEGELPGVSTPANVTYIVELMDGNNTMILDIESGGGVWWRFKMVKTEGPPAPGPTSPAVGTWNISPVAGSLGVGPALGDVSWWAIEDQGVIDRACFFDDDYVFAADGTFSNVLGDETWIEGWQSGGAPDACGAPVAPHDGMSPGTWSYDEGAGTMTIDGFGAYLGIPKAVNEGELPGVATPPNVTYMVEFTDDNNMVLDIESGGGVWWRFLMTKQ
ncbi:MAG: glycoside hydrolase family 16 protein [Gammaproteobacteria bacterium]